MKHLLKKAESLNWAINLEALEGIIAVIQEPGIELNREDFHAASEAAELEASAQFDERPEGTRYTQIAGSTGALFITGPIVPRADWITEASGLVSIDRLTSEFIQLEKDPEIQEILLVMDTPGGDVTGISQFASLVAGCDKHVTAYVYGMAASAGYWIASAAEAIVGADTSLVGSIGVVHKVKVEKDEKTVTTISSQSPLKNVSPDTKEGKAEVQRLVDSLAEVFISAVAENRGVAEETVLKDYGKGAVFVAKDAQARDMIDAVMTLEEVLNGIVKGQLPTRAATFNIGADSAADKEAKTMATEEKTYTQAELDAAVDAARERGAAEATATLEGVNARINAAVPFLLSEEYPDKVKALAVKTLTGENSPEVLQAAAAILDTDEEKKTETKAEEDTEAVAPTAPEGPEAGAEAPSQDGIIRNDADVAGAIDFVKTHAMTI